ncbi:MAG: flagellar export chaperone FliS [Bacillota bacterium]
MTYNNASQQYAKTKIQTASSGDLVIMLYQGCIKFMRLARKSMEQGDIPNTNNYLIRSQDIIMELLTTLDNEKGGEVARNLAALYEYMHRELIQANLTKDPEPIDQVEEIMLELLEAWQEAVKKDRKENGRDRLNMKVGGR